MNAICTAMIARPTTMYGHWVASLRPTTVAMTNGVTAHV